MSQIQTLLLSSLVHSNVKQYCAVNRFIRQSPGGEDDDELRDVTDPQFMNYCNFKLLVKTNYAYKMTFFGQNMQKNKSGFNSLHR
jgi:hypothetical protein